MSFQTSFKQILRDKMAQTNTSTSASPRLETHSEPAYLAFLMGQVGRFEFQTRRGHYPSPAARTPVARAAHALNEMQKVAFDFLKSLIADLSEGFTAVELKKAFRQAALQVHPDRGGSTEQFIELKAHYQTLKTVIDKDVA